MRPGFQMTFGTDPGAVAQAVARFAEFAEAHALPTPVRRSIQVALDEFVYNPIVYGFAERGSGEGEVRVELERGVIRVTITDDGPEFDPLAFATPDTDLSVEERGIGGLGIHLVRKMMDEVTYHRRGETNVVVLTKRLAAGETAGHRGGSSMEITTRTQGDITIVAIAGNLDSITSPEAQKALDAVIAGGAKKIRLLSDQKGFSVERILVNRDPNRPSD